MSSPKLRLSNQFGNRNTRTAIGFCGSSTLVVLRGDQELGRIVAQTGEADIRALMDLGLS